jgi:hypothetical protein
MGSGVILWAKDPTTGVPVPVEVDASDITSLKVKEQGTPTTLARLYDKDGVGIQSHTLDGTITTQQAILTKTVLCAKSTTNEFHPVYMAAYVTDNLPNSIYGIRQMSYLLGYNGTAWDRLRTYGLGVLKVARAEAGLSISVTQTSATIKASAGNIYWITIMGVDAANGSFVAIRDGGSGGTHKWSGGVPGVQRTTLHVVFDPPIGCATNIYAALTADGGGTNPIVTVGYL